MNRRKFRIGDGQVYRWEHWGIYAFTTTGATLTVRVPMRDVEAAFVCAVGTPAADEILSVNNTVTGTVGADTARIAGDAAGWTDLVVTRTGASKTSGLKFSLIARGK